MSETGTETKPSMARRIIGYFDPGRDGFLGRMVRLFGGFAVVGMCVLSIAASMWFTTETGRHFVVYFLIDLGFNEQAEPRAAELVADYPESAWEYYRLHGMSLRRLGRFEESLQVYDDALEVVPDAWWAHSHRCFYTTILTGDAESVMDSCDMSIELEPSAPGVAHDRRAIARAVVGDLEGALSDLERAIEIEEGRGWSGYAPAQEQARYAWLEALKAGENPIDDEELRLERLHY